MCANVANAAWAQRAAREIVANFSDEAAVETANYRECGFIMQAALLALSDEKVAARIGQMMEPPREIDRVNPVGESC